MIVNATYMVHEGGTKFYEVVELQDVAAKRFMLIRRWGRADQAFNGGGQVKIETFTDVRKCHQASAKVRSEKNGRGYSDSHISYGLHGTAALRSEESVRLSLPMYAKKHYADSDVVERILAFMNVDTGWEKAEEVNDIVVEEPPVIERGEEWGSW